MILGVLVSLLLSAPPIDAQAVKQGHQTEPGNGITLLQAVKQTLIKQPSVLIAQSEIDIRAGVLQERIGEFDWRHVTSVSWEDKGRPLSERERLSTGKSKAETEVVIYQTGLEKKLRSGIVLGPDIELFRTTDRSFGEETRNEAGVNFNVVLPLLRGRGREATAAGEMAAEADLEASRLDLRHTVSATIVNTAQAYWKFIGARKQLDILKKAESRAESLVRDIRRLIRADERPAADLDYLLANLADKGTARIASEQRLLEARHGLGLAMGLSSEEVLSFPEPLDPFPDAKREGIPLPSDKKRLIDLAFKHRADLMASKKMEESAKILLVGARNRTKPRVDLVLSAGYSGLNQGERFGDAASSFYSNTGGLNTFASLSYERPIGNHSARGRVAQQKAEHRKTVIGTSDRERKIYSAVAVAARDIRQRFEELEKAREAVTAHRRAADNEKEKLHRGMSTVIDIITMEDRLRNALLGEVRSHQNYADALVRLRFETGTLLSGDENGYSIEAGTLRSVPST